MNRDQETQLVGVRPAPDASALGSSLLHFHHHPEVSCSVLALSGFLVRLVFHKPKAVSNFESRLFSSTEVSHPLDGPLAFGPLGEPNKQ